MFRFHKLSDVSSGRLDSNANTIIILRRRPLRPVPSIRCAARRSLASSPVTYSTATRFCRVRRKTHTGPSREFSFRAPGCHAVMEIRGAGSGWRQYGFAVACRCAGGKYELRTAETLRRCKTPVMEIRVDMTASCIYQKAARKSAASAWPLSSEKENL